MFLWDSSVLYLTCRNEFSSGWLITSAWQPCVCVGVHKQLHLEQVSDVLRVEHQDALKQHHVSGVHRHRLLLPATQSAVISSCKPPQQVRLQQQNLRAMVGSDFSTVLDCVFIPFKFLRSLSTMATIQTFHSLLWHFNTLEENGCPTSQTTKHSSSF